MIKLHLQFSFMANMVVLPCYDWFGIKFFTQSPSLVFIFVFILTAGVSVSQPPTTVCSFDDQIILGSNNTDCEAENWDGFVKDGCCGHYFNGYLYLLGQRANQTGKIYFNATAQRNCLFSLNSAGRDISGCGFERLTSGEGGCSDFSVADVVKEFRTELSALEGYCQLLGFDDACGTCMRKWEEVKESLAHNKKIKGDTDVCGFAILVSLTSYRIEDKMWAHKLYQCLGSAKKEDKKPKIEEDLGLLVGGLAGIAIVVIIAIWVLLKRKIKSNFMPKTDESEEYHEDLNCQKIPMKEIYSATNNLNVLNFIGQGIAGKVYKGVLWNGVPVAVKHIVSSDGHMETFVREVTSMSHVKHPNLVALLGHCEEKHECFLVYELCPNGNLSEWLFGKEKVLSWIQRLEIAIDSARGLWFLHTFPEGCIVHRDVKPTNILLGTNFEAKLSDFGLSKVIDVGMSYVSSEVRGTFGYVDPEYHKNHHVNSYGDVYSFGIVLLQLISGKRVINLNLQKPMSLDKIAKFLKRGGSVGEFADPKLNGEYSTKAFDDILKLALSCTTHKHLRPTMEQVVKRLENSLDLSTKEKTYSI